MRAPEATPTPSSSSLPAPPPPAHQSVNGAGEKPPIGESLGFFPSVGRRDERRDPPEVSPSQGEVELFRSVVARAFDNQCAGRTDEQVALGAAALARY